ncbi:hypothetical protein ACHAWC_002837 [Mediolabrus comicus]
MSIQAALRSMATTLPVKRSSPNIGCCSSWSSRSSAAAFSSSTTKQQVEDNPPPSSTTSASEPSQQSSSSPSYNNNNSNNNRIKALSLYRQLLRGAERMPTPNRQNYIKRKTRSEFRKHKALVDPSEIEFQLRLADTNLDTVLVQAEHLSRLFNDPEYQNYN